MEEDTEFLPRNEILSYDEIVRVARVAHDLGVRSLRITGGEPLVRKDVPHLIEQLSSIGFADLALTTNASQLKIQAQALVDAGLMRINVSCDSLDPKRFARIRRRGDLADVLTGMDEAERVGLLPLKVNVVLMRGQNDDEILPFAKFARATGRIVRFIEFMPLDAAGHWDRDLVVPGAEVVNQISERWPLEPIIDVNDNAPATRFRFVDGQGEIGIVASVTQPFCATCNRLRVTADGSIRNCLFSDDELSLRAVLRNGGSNDELAQLFRRATWAKRAGHGINESQFIPPVRSMSMIGG